MYDSKHKGAENDNVIGLINESVRLPMRSIQAYLQTIELDACVIYSEEFGDIEPPTRVEMEWFLGKAKITMQPLRWK